MSLFQMNDNYAIDCVKLDTLRLFFKKYLRITHNTQNNNNNNNNTQISIPP